jgi:hypothetical protein
VTNGSVTSLSGSGTTYTAAITPTADGDVLISISQNVAVDIAQNGNQASQILTRTIGSINTNYQLGYDFPG